MHNYQFEIKKYRADTAHLTVEEHGIYRWLLDELYHTELPLSEGPVFYARKMRLTGDQIPLLETVLVEFFIPSDDGWTHETVNAELERIYAKSDQARISADIRWAEHNKKKKENTDALNNNADAMRSHTERNADGMLPITHYPLPITQKDNNTRVETPEKKPPKSPPCPYQAIVDLYHEKLPMCPKVVTITDARKKSMKARWTNGAHGMEFWGDYFTFVGKSKFLTGRVDPGPGRKQFVADIDFLIREKTIVSTQEGKYHG